MPSPLFKNGDRLNLLKVIERLKVDLPEEDVSADPVRQELCDLIVHMLWGRHGENIIEFFKSPLFRFFEVMTKKWDFEFWEVLKITVTWHEEEDHDERYDIQTSVKSESANASHRTQQTRES